MKIAIKHILKDHNERTGEKLSQYDLAREMVRDGICNSFYSARNMLQYNVSGKAKNLDAEMIQFLMKRFNLKLDEVITDIYN